MKIIRLAFFSLFCLFHTAVKAEDYWDIRQIALSKAAVVPLKKSDGSVYFDLPTVSAKEIVEVTDKFSLLSGVYPKLLLKGSNVVNAFATYNEGEPLVVLNKGILDLIEKDKSSVAALLGHEISHLYLGHLQKKAAVNQNTEVLASFIGGFLEAFFIGRYGVVGLGVNLSNDLKTVVESAYSRDYERDADRQGMIWAIQAGYDPNGASRLFKELEKSQGNSVIPFLSSHPNPSERFETAIQLSEDLSKFQPIEGLTNSSLFALNRKIDQDHQKQLPTSPEGIEAISLLQSKNYSELKQKLEVCSAKGEVACINNLGVVYQYGLGVQPDRKEAAKQFKIASEKGSGAAQFSYITLYAAGVLGPPDTLKIIEMALEASEKGSPRAMGTFAYAVQTTQLLPREYAALHSANLPKESVIIDYAKASAMRGTKDGQLALGNFYISGWGVPKNIDLAEKYLLQALAQNDVRAYAGLLNIYESVRPDASKAKSITSRLSSNKNLDSVIAQFRVWFYCGSTSTSNEFKQKCFELAQKARSQSVGPIAYGYALSQGIGTEKNVIEGAAWLVAYTAKNNGNFFANAMNQRMLEGKSDIELSKIRARAAEIAAANFK